MKLQTHTHILNTLLGTKAQRDVFAYDPLTGMRLVPEDPSICYIDGDGEGEGGTPAKSFSQEDVDRIVKTRLKKAETENAKLSKRADSAEKSMGDLNTKFEKLQETYDASNKSDVEKDLGKAQRAMAKLESERDAALAAQTAAETAAETAANGLKTTQLQGTLREALRNGKAHGQGMDQAVQLMLANGATLDDEGAFQMSIDGVPYDKPTEAASKWLETNTHFLDGAGGGSATPRGGGGKLLPPSQMSEMSTNALISAGLKNSPTG